MKGYIEKYYEEYLQKYKIKLPNINIRYEMEKSILNNSIAYINLDTINNKCVDLFLDKTIFSYNKDYIKSILFHEFTHLNDYFYLKSQNVKDIDDIMSSYSEYHASKEELLSYFNRKFKMSDKITYKNEIISVENYLLYPLSSVLQTINSPRNSFLKLSDMDYNIKYVTMFKNLSYYLGKYSACENYSINKPHNFFDNFGKFKNIILDLYSLYDQNDFENIIKAKNQFESFYFEYFYFT